MAVQKRNDELVDILSADFLRKRYPLTATDRFGGMIEMTVEMDNSTTITIIDTNIFDPVDLLHYSTDVAADSGDSRSIMGMLAQGESINLFDVSGETVQLRLTSGGAVELQRTAGTLTYAIVLRLRWLFDTYSVATHGFILDWHPQRVSVETATTRRISSGFQLLIHGAYTINGALIDDGDLVIL